MLSKAESGLEVVAAGIGRGSTDTALGGATVAVEAMAVEEVVAVAAAGAAY